MKSQSFFTSTKDQFKDNSWTPESTIGLYDASLETVPVAKGAIAVTKTVVNTSKSTPQGLNLHFIAICNKI